MQKRTFALVVFMTLAGFGLGLVTMNYSNDTPAVAQTSSSQSNVDLPVECRSALRMASEGFNTALQGISQAQQASYANTPTGAPTPARGMLGQATMQVQAMLHQYEQARSTCESMSAARNRSTPTSAVK